jgi:predicted lipoprotein with Yx(FWY)xxD motif
MRQITTIVSLLLLFLMLPSESLLWAAPGEDGIAICLASNVQSLPSIAPAGGGGSIIVWQDYRNGAADIYTQKINAAGVAYWTSDGIPVCTSASSEYSPTAVSDGSGGTIITWQDNRSGNYDIYAQRISALGTPIWTVNGISVCTASGNQEIPQIASDGAGGAIIVWRDQRDGDYDLYMQRISSSGSIRWSSNGIPLCNAANDQFLPAIVTYSGGIMLAWPDGRGGNTDIYAQKVNLNGNDEWTANGVAVCLESSKQNHVQLTSDGSGGAIITWRDRRPGLTYDIYAQRIASNGTPQWTADGVAVCTEPNDQNRPGITGDGIGGAIIAWEDRRTYEYDIFAQRVDASGNIQWSSGGSSICSATNSQYVPQVVSDGAGGAIIGWEDSRSGNWDIYSQRIAQNGSIHWTNNGINICSSSGTQYEICLLANGAGGATFTWTDERAGFSDPNIYTNAVDQDGSFEVPTAVKTYFAVLDGTAIKIQWELSESGAGMRYSLFRAEGTAADFEEVTAPEILQERMSFTFIDRTVRPERSYRYRVNVTDEEGAKTLFETGPITVPGIALALGQNHPNPFNPSTTISFSLPEAAPVQLSIVNAEGKLVKTLVDDTFDAGVKEVVWNGTDAAGSRVSSGVYFYRLRSGKSILTRKMVLVK